MSNDLFAVYRNSTLNGNTLEVRQPFGYFHSQEEADAKAESLTDAVTKNVALRGFSFTFYVKKILTDGTAE
jgi:hypothetical protein